MRRLGLIGGMSWQSTALYYRLLNEDVGERLGGLHSAECLVLSVDFATIEALQAQGRWDEAGRQLAAAARSLQAAGAEALVLCTNTMHAVSEQIEAAVDVPLLHIADATGAAARRLGLGRVALVGTAFMMEQDVIAGRLRAHGLEVLVPGPADRALVHRVIYDELCVGRVLPQSRAQVRQVLATLVGRGAQGVVLGCTELELLVSQQDCTVPVLATTQLHARAAVDWALDTGDAP